MESVQKWYVCMCSGLITAISITSQSIADDVISALRDAPIVTRVPEKPYFTLKILFLFTAMLTAGRVSIFSCNIIALDTKTKFKIDSNDMIKFNYDLTT